MAIDVWLNRSEHLVTGTELYRSKRSCTWWDYTPSHSQLLLRSDGSADTTRIDVLFKAVDVMKVRSHYNGLRIRCATLAEQEQIQDETPEITYIDPASNKFDQGSRYFVLEASDGFDYVVANAVGWHEDYDLGEPSYYADPSRGTAPWSQTKPRWAETTLDGVNGGLGTPMATIDELATAIATTENIPAEDRTRYRYIYIVIGQAFVPDPTPSGRFSPEARRSNNNSSWPTDSPKEPSPSTRFPSGCESNTPRDLVHPMPDTCRRRTTCRPVVLHLR